MMIGVRIIVMTFVIVGLAVALGAYVGFPENVAIGSIVGALVGGALSDFIRSRWARESAPRDL